MPDTIYIVGAGAIGKVLAVFLKLAGKSVTLVRGSIDDGSGSQELIEVELPDDRIVEARVETTTLSRIDRFEGVVVLACKTFGNAALAKALYGKTGRSPLIIMQNGLNIERPFIDRVFPSIFRCVLFATSQPIGDNRYRFRPVAASPIGAVNGADEIMENIIAKLTNGYFQFRPESNIYPFVWTKTIINCVFNSICPLLETDNGVFCRNAQAVSIAERIIAECLAAAAASGVFLQPEEVMQTLLTISKSSEGQLISTYVDILNKRETEIDSLNFAIAGIADNHGIIDVVKETRLLGELIKLKSCFADSIKIVSVN